MNIENCQLEGLIPKKNNLLRVDNLIFTSYEYNSCFIIPKLLLRCLKTLKFCFVEDNKMFSGIIIYN